MLRSDPFILFSPHHTEIDEGFEENNFILKKEGFFKTFVVLVLG